MAEPAATNGNGSQYTIRWVFALGAAAGLAFAAWCGSNVVALQGSKQITESALTGADRATEKLAATVERFVDKLDSRFDRLAEKRESDMKDDRQWIEAKFSEQTKDRHSDIADAEGRVRSSLAQEVGHIETQIAGLTQWQAYLFREVKGFDMPRGETFNVTVSDGRK